jgi:hypothetical protein
MGGLQLSISGIIGPALGGFLIVWTTPAVVFASNACGFLLLIFAIAQLKLKKPPRNFALTDLFESFFKAVRYIRCVPNIRSILAQNVFFALSISIVPSLLPLLCFKVLKLSSLNLGLVFACMGIGSVTAAAAVLPRIRRGFSSNAIIRLATVLLVPALFLMAFGRVPEILFVAAGLAAAAWTIAGSELWVVGQRAMPRWARAPLGAVFVVTAQGAIVIGGVVLAFLGRELGITLASSGRLS